MKAKAPTYGMYADMETDTIEKKRMYKVVQKNDLIQKARHSLTEKEMKLVDFCVSKVKDSDKQFYEINTTLEEINEVMGFGVGGKNIETTLDSLLKISNKGFWLADKENPEVENITRWLNKATVNKKTHECTLLMDNILLPYLIFNTEEGGYTQYPLYHTTQISGKYALSLFKLLKSWSNVGGVSGTPEEFLSYFDKADTTWTNFNKLYLKPAIEQLNKKRVFENNELVYRGVKKGKYVTEVQLTLEPRMVEDSNEFDEALKLNWLNA